MHADRSYLRHIAYTAIRDKAYGPEPCKYRGHDFTTVRRVVSITADFLEHNDRGLRGGLDVLEQIVKSGYTRSVQRPDGKIVTIYYFPEQQFTERVIAATIWDPGSKA